MSEEGLVVQVGGERRGGGGLVVLGSASSFLRG